MNTKVVSLIILLILFTTSKIYAQTAPVGWHLDNRNYGVNLQKALDLLKNKNAKEVIIAIIDNGVDTAHIELQGKLWINKKEIPNNGKDDDNNGYIDDIHGWNFLGSSDGKYDLTSAGTEAYREYKKLRDTYKNIDVNSLDEAQKNEYTYYKKMESEARITPYINYTEQLAFIAGAFLITDSILSLEFPEQIPSVRELSKHKFVNIDAELSEAIEIAIQTASNQSLLQGRDLTWKDALKENINKYLEASQRIKNLDDPLSDPRLGIDDNPSNFGNFHYGNNHIYLHDSGQGTVHAGIISASGNNDIGFTGVYPEAKIMILRALPQGEEYDKDVAASIRYAVDNGAQIINIGFCKTISPHAIEVTKALEYALANNVLVVRAAGDNSKDLDIVPTYPAYNDSNLERLKNMLIVGASTSNGDAASFSNYGNKSIDVYAPGHDVVSIFPNNEYARFEGSSISTAIISGIAAIVYAYFPNIKAEQVRNIIIGTCNPMNSSLVNQSADNKGIVNAEKIILSLLNKN